MSDDLELDEYVLFVGQGLCESPNLPEHSHRLSVCDHEDRLNFLARDCEATAECSLDASAVRRLMGVCAAWLAKQEATP